MLTLITGAPRSGKTYYAVDFISKEYEKYKRGLSKYKSIITNINGFNYDYFDGFVKHYNKSDFENAMQQEFISSKNNDNRLINHDGDYDKWCINNGIYEHYHHSLIVIDEAYNVFEDKFEDYKGRFLSYHGHFGIDIFFIVQSKRQTNRQYIVHTEVTVVAYPSGKRLLNTSFRYKLYSTSDLKKDNEIENISIRFNNNVAKLYNSGSTQIYKSFVGKKFLIIILLAFILYVWFFVFKPPTYSESTIKDNNTISSDNITHSSTYNQLPKNSSFNLDNSPILVICYPTSCRFSGYTITLVKDNFLKLLLKNECEIFIQEQISFNLAHYYINCNSTIYDFLNPFKEVKNEKVNRSDSKYL